MSRPPTVSRRRSSSREIKPLLPRTAQVRSGAQEATKQTQDTSAFTGFLQKFLLAFGGIALFVGVFVIANTLSITIAQRAREFGTLRTLGATRRQVMTSVIVEGGVIGVLASVSGLFIGLGLAKGLEALFVAFGIDLPHGSTIFATRTVVVSLLVGTIVTHPREHRCRPCGRRASSRSPLFVKACCRPRALPASGCRPPLGTMAVALALLLFGGLAKGATGTERLLAIGVGVLASFVGMALVAPRFVPPLASALGYPASRLGGVAGSLARENAMRNPARTASTAAALMIGLALVTAVGVLSSGIKATFEHAVDTQFLGDYALTSENGFTPTGVASENAVRGVPGVLVVSGVRAGEARAFGSHINVTGVEPNVGRVIKITWKEGGQGVPAALGTNGAFVDSAYAKDHHVTVGSPIPIELPTGETVPLKVQGIFKAPAGGSPFGNVTISTKLFDKIYPEPQNVFAFMNMDGGVTAANTAALTSALKTFPDAKVQTESAFKKQQESGINVFLNLLYVLLSLSIIVSLFGIVNTLVLSVFERTRELGMLRAVGMTRRQTRRMIRHESVVTALIGASLGIPLGVGLALLVGEALGFVHDRDPVGNADRLRDRRDHRRAARCDLPGAACCSAERAPGAPVRVTLAELLRGYVAADEQEEADRCAMLRLIEELQRPFSRDEPSAHFTASAFVVDETCARVCLVQHVKLGRLLQPGGHIEPSDRTFEAAALREAREETELELEFHPAAPRPFDLDIHEIPERPGEPAHFHLDVRYLLIGRGEPCAGAAWYRNRRSGGRVGRSPDRKGAAPSNYLGSEARHAAELERARGQPRDGLGGVVARRRDVVRRVRVEERGEQLDLLAARPELVLAAAVQRDAACSAHRS